jgi:signal transduction histidine kinase
MLVKGEAIGVLGVYTKQEHAFSDEEVEFLSALAAEAAIAIHNAQLYEQTKKQAAALEKANDDLKRREEIQRFLKELSQDITTMDLESLLQKLTNLVRDFLKVDICDVRIRHPDGARHVVASGIAVEKLLSDRGHGVVRWENYAAAKQVVRISDLNKQSDSASEQSTVRGLGLRGYVGAPFFSKDGSFLGVIRALTYVPRDFSQPEMDLIQQLANEVAVAIQNAQLYRDLEKSDKVKTEFLGVMSHELRTPLNVIIGYTNLMLDGVLGEINPQMNDGLQKVTRQSKDLLSMVESIMEATKIESESVVVETHEVDLSNFLADLRSSYGAHVEKDVSLAWDYPSALPVIKTDNFKLAHILHNLINNALKFTEAGKVTISARVVEHDAQRAKSMAQGDKRKEPAATATPSALPSALSDTTSYVQFSVSDTGIGMEEKDLTTIFDMFRQVDSSNTRLYGGAGLGLYIVKKFTEMLGGNVSVASEAGKGSTFTVRVPLS